MQKRILILFDGFRLDPATNCLLRGEDEVLTGKPVQMLHYLIQCRSCVVSREELLQRVWPEGMIEKDVVKATMWRIRKALGDDASNPRFIRAVGRQGYRFIGNITTLAVDLRAVDIMKSFAEFSVESALADPAFPLQPSPLVHRLGSRLIDFLYRFRGMTLYRLLRPSYVEAEIFDDLYHSVIRFLRSHQFQHVDKVFSDGRHYLKVFFEPAKTSRALNLFLSPVPVMDVGPSLIDDIEHFGLIRHIQLKTSSNLPFASDKLLARIKNQLLLTYSALEKVFLEKVEDFNVRIFDPLYKELKSQLDFKKKSHLFDRCWFSFSDGKIDVYGFNTSMLREVIAHLKAHQHPILSPFELVTCLVMNPFPFEKTLALQSWQAKRDLTLLWENVPYLSDVPNNLTAEMLLYNSKGERVLTIFEKRNLFLIFSCPMELDDPLVH